ncbi:MAG: nitrogen fixation protein FixH [Alphaproteobacteria bacterium HGW-Alphaproteobacteria-6]|nr:MAG: nitrogen fixation protein FixH [Alphaproteobacteria bacterium HGW-Alphaproteobacteria-6]
MATPLTGRRVLLIAVAAFGTIFAVNITMAVLAVRSFPGLEVRNSYVASQVFDAERSAQKALGWTLAHRYESGQVRLSFRDSDGLPVRVADLSATVGRTTAAADDRHPDFVWQDGDYVAATDLGPGRWMILLEAFAADGTRFHQRLDLRVGG